MSSKKRKGLSADDKRSVILGVYHEKKEPLNLKEIENLASKKGVVAQTVKEHNQSLVDDGIVLSDKIGSSNFYWSFPSKAYVDRITKRNLLSSQLSMTEKAIGNLETKITQAVRERNDTTRSAKLSKLRDLKRQDEVLSEKLESLKKNDPEEISRIQSLSSTNKSAADRWTDNIWSIKRYLTKRKGLSGKEVDKILFIDGSFDYFVYDNMNDSKSGRKKDKS